MYSIRKEFTFSASHCLDHLSSKHPCSSVHGHNYVVTVELKSEKLDKHHFVVDYHDLKVVKQFLDNTFDHKHLNNVMEEPPTAENIARFLYYTFKPMLPQLFAVEVSETPKTSARYGAS